MGKTSIDPEIAFTTNKPIFLEFYAEWCEVCKKMSPGVSQLRKEYGKDINFVFINVDNPKWEKYIKEMNVNGIPQINLFDNESNLEKTFIGLQDESDIKQSLINLLSCFLFGKSPFKTKYATSSKSHLSHNSCTV